MRSALASLTALALFACSPQTTPRPSAPASGVDPVPASVAQSFFDALHDERWDAAAHQLDLDRFAIYLRERIADIERFDTASIPPMTAEQIMRVEPDMPRHVAEYLVDRARASQARFADHLVSQFADVPDLDSLRRLPVRTAAARWLEAQDLRYQMRRARAQLRESGCELPEEEPGTTDERRRRVVGAIVAEKAPADTVAYVLYRVEFGEGRPSGALVPTDSTVAGDEPAAEEEWYVPEPEVVVLRRSGAEWKVLPSAGGFGPGSVVMTVDDCRSSREEQQEPSGDPDGAD